MINKLLTKFERTDSVNGADFGEKVGNIGLGLLRIGFGKTLTVDTISGNANKTVFTNKVHSMSVRVAAVALFILALPITLLLAGIGFIGTTLSNSHKPLFNLYIQSENQKVNPQEGVEVENEQLIEKEQTSQSAIESELPKSKNKKRVTFGAVRGREFDKASPPDEVGKMKSVELKVF